MRQLIYALLWLPILLSAPFVGAEERGCERLVATGNPEYTPYLWRDSANRQALLGANQILMDEVSQRLRIPIALIYVGPWSRAQEEVRAGRVDLIAGAFFTLPRTRYMDYIQPPFLTTRSVVWKRKFVDFQYRQWEDLIPYVGATVIDNSFGQAFDRFAEANLNIETVAGLEQAFRMLAQGRVDYVLYEEYPGRAYAEQMDLSLDIERTGPPISEEELFLTISRQSDCNTEAMRQRLAVVMRSIVDSGFPREALNRGLEAWSRQK